jgi:hypothetical protein
VGNRDGDLVGIVTLSDVEDAIIKGQTGVTAAEICSRSLLVCHPDEPLGDALRQLGARDVGRLPVVDRENPRRLLGMLRRADVVVAYSRFACQREEERTERAMTAAGAPQDRLEGLRFTEIRLGPDAPAVGRQVRDLDLPDECILVSIRRGDRALIPRGDTVLQTGDQVFALGDPECALALRQGVGGCEALAAAA